MRLLDVLMLSAVVALCACGRPADSPALPPVPASGASSPQADGAWLGRWQGPEGTFLEIAGGPGAYRVTVQNLDGPRTFDAMSGSNTLVFTRDGVIETLRAGSGPETGMKWLADKRVCLIVKTGEGYCRD